MFITVVHCSVASSFGVHDGTKLYFPCKLIERQKHLGTVCVEIIASPLARKHDLVGQILVVEDSRFSCVSAAEYKDDLFSWLQDIFPLETAKLIRDFSGANKNIVHPNSLVPMLQNRVYGSLRDLGTSNEKNYYPHFVYFLPGLNRKDARDKFFAGKRWNANYYGEALVLGSNKELKWHKMRYEMFSLPRAAKSNWEYYLHPERIYSAEWLEYVDNGVVLFDEDDPTIMVYLALNTKSGKFHTVHKASTDIHSAQNTRNEKIYDFADRDISPNDMCEMVHGKSEALSPEMLMKLWEMFLHREYEGGSIHSLLQSRFDLKLSEEHLSDLKFKMDPTSTPQMRNFWSTLFGT